MINPYYYLFYKVSRLLNKRGDNEWGPVYAISVLMGLNIGIVYIRMFDVTRDNFEHGYKAVLIIIGIILFAANCILFLNKKRCREIERRFKNESIVNRRIGNALIIIYVLLTFLSLLLA